MSWLVRRFGPRIRLDVSREQFVWTRGERRTAIPTFLYLDPGRRIILSVGEAPPGAHVRVGAFESADTLAKFVKFGFEQILGRRLTLRPYVHLAGATDADAETIRTALRAAGAGAIVS